MNGPWTTHSRGTTSTTPRCDEHLRPDGRSTWATYLRATASYADDHQSGKMAMAIDGDDGARRAGPLTVSACVPGPEHLRTDWDTDRNRPGPWPEKTPSWNRTSAIRSWPLTVTSDTLTYTLTDEGGGTGDSASFGIDPATGQLKTKDWAGLRRWDCHLHPSSVEVRDPFVASTPPIGPTTGPQASVP